MAVIHQGPELAHPAIRLNRERCAGCQECIVRCPTGALQLDRADWICSPDEDLCVGCRQCERTCPYSAIAIDGPMLVAPAVEVPTWATEPLRYSTQEARRGFTDWEEAAAEASRCLQCPDPTCVLGCPAHNDIPGFIRALREGDLAAAHSTLRKTTIFPDICSRVCDQSIQCEGACSWNLAGGAPVQIGLLERFVADQHPVPPVSQPDQTVALSVAVVGAGPAGMSAAWELLAAGAQVVMYERDPQPLGVLRWGIPDFTLPEKIARRPLQALQAAGLQLVTGVEIGRDRPLGDLLAAHDAVILAHGATLPSALRAEGTESVPIEDATAFLTRAKEALVRRTDLTDLPPGSRLLVVGAGNTAMDVARTARRLGATVFAVEWMDRRFAKVRRDELEQAEREGVEIRFNTAVERFSTQTDGGVAAELRRTRQRSAKVRPAVLPEPPEALGPIDLVVVATGYRVDATPLRGLNASLPLPGAPRPVFRDRRLQATGLPSGSESMACLVEDRAAALARVQVPISGRVFAAGDALTGPATVVTAMAQGKAAARSAVSAWEQGNLRRSRAAEQRMAALPVTAPPSTRAVAKVAQPSALRMTGLALVIFGGVSCLSVVGLVWGVLPLLTGAFLLLLDVLGIWVNRMVEGILNLVEETPEIRSAVRREQTP